MFGLYSRWIRFRFRWDITRLFSALLAALRLGVVHFSPVLQVIAHNHRCSEWKNGFCVSFAEIWITFYGFFNLRKISFNIERDFGCEMKLRDKPDMNWVIQMSSALAKGHKICESLEFQSLLHEMHKNSNEIITKSFKAFDNNWHFNAFYGQSVH